MRRTDGAGGLPGDILSDVLQVERLREVLALVGFIGWTGPTPTIPSW